MSYLTGSGSSPAGILKFVRMTGPNTWDTPQVVDDAPYIRKQSSIGIVDGVPVISYLDENNLVLRVATSLVPGV